ncbi:MAG: hypothetical protein JNM10_08905 [Planctomycetia bacterium]|nr:hypothetical protein [Planctomycetia bacterium]
MGLIVQASREILHRNPFPAGDPRHAAAGDEILEALLLGTDAEGFAGDRVLMLRARAWLADTEGFGAPTVGEAYRLRSADRVEVLFLRSVGNPRAVPGLPGRYDVGLAHAVEVTRRDELAFRTSPCWRRAGGRGWLLFDPGDGPPVARSAGRDALEAAQRASLAAGLALDAEARAAIAGTGAARVDVPLALRATSLPRSVRDRAAAPLAATAALADVVVALGDVAGSCDREEGETYARAAGRLVQRAATLAEVAAPPGPA